MIDTVAGEDLAVLLAGGRRLCLAQRDRPHGDGFRQVTLLPERPQPLLPATVPPHLQHGMDAVLGQL